ncbi:MAG: tetratricopeptide repeat protein, partial [Flavobacteriales bacterium]
MNLFKKYLFALLLFILIIGCSTEKDKRLNKFYHNTTAYYNGYFNAREIIKVSDKEYKRATPEDFTVLIPVNRYPNEEESKGFFPEMNRAIDKTSTVISKHAMPNVKKGRDAKEEYGKWMDENWLVMGISYFYKREYEPAIEKFEYIVKMYPKDESKYYAKLWLAKTYIEMGDFPKAFSYLNEIEVEKSAKQIKEEKQKNTKERRKKYKKRKKKKVNKRSSIKRTKQREEAQEERSFLVEFPEKLSADYFATIADFHLRRNQFKEAVEFLDSAIHYEKTKKLRVRYNFIQAQLHQELGSFPLASEKYTYVIKKSSSYQMVFYSKINRALSASSKDRGALKEELIDLAKDEKYIEFRDQIYYALAN